MIIVVAALEFATEADRDRAVALTADVQRLTREEEQGCHDYCFAPDPAIPTRMQVYELWEDSDSLAAHFEHPYYERMASLLQGVGIVESTNQAYLVERGEPVYTEAGEKRPAFFRTDGGPPPSNRQSYTKGDYRLKAGPLSPVMRILRHTLFITSQNPANGAGTRIGNANMKKVAQYPMLIATLGIMLFSMMDAVMKGQALAMGTYNAMFWRMAMGALIVAVLYLPTRPVPASGRVLKIHLIRAALTAVMAYLFFFGLTRIPLAQAIGLSFIAPIITLFLAVPILGERIGANAKLAAVLGFGGVMVVVGGELLAVDEGSDAVGMAAVLLSAVMYAFNLVLQRMQALVAKPLEIAFYQNTIVFVMLLVGVPFAVSWPASQLQWGGAMLAAAFAVGSLMLMSLAYRQAEAQRLVVIEYTAFIWAALLGWWFFAEPVTARTLLGTGLIVLGCLVSARGGGR